MHALKRPRALLARDAPSLHWARVCPACIKVDREPCPDQLVCSVCMRPRFSCLTLVDVTWMSNPHWLYSQRHAMLLSLLRTCALVCTHMHEPLQVPVAGIRSAAVINPASDTCGIPHTCSFVVRGGALSPAALAELGIAVGEAMGQSCMTSCCPAYGLLPVHTTYKVPPPLPPERARALRTVLPFWPCLVDPSATASVLLRSACHTRMRSLKP